MKSNQLYPIPPTVAAGVPDSWSECTTIATCWKITRTDGTIFRFTNNSDDLSSFDGDEATPVTRYTYLAGAGFTPSEIVTSGDLAVDNLDVEGMVKSPSITEEDLMAGKWDYAKIVIFEVDYSNVYYTNVIRKGTIGEVSIHPSFFSAELRGMTQPLQQTIGELTSLTCRARLGDSRCTKDLTAFTVTGIVDSANSDGRTIFDSARTEPGPPSPATITNISGSTVTCVNSFSVGQAILITDVVGCVKQETLGGTLVPGTSSINGQTVIVKTRTGTSFTFNPLPGTYSAYVSGGKAQELSAAGYFDNGLMTMTSGANAGLPMEVKSYAPGVICLQLPFPHLTEPGDTYTLVAGCTGRFLEDCRDKFNNVIWFRGEPHIPGFDHVVKGVSSA